MHFTFRSYSRSAFAAREACFTARCTKCASPCRVVPLSHRDGRVEPSDIYCLNRRCELGPPNLVDQRFDGVAHHEVVVGPGFFTHHAVGRPDQGEGNVRRAAHAFIEFGKRDFRLGLTDLGPSDPQVEQGFDYLVRKHDGVTLRLQITRALPSEDFYSRLGREGEVTRSLSLREAAERLRAAIEHKSVKASRSRDIDLLIDATLALELAFVSEQVLVALHGDWLRNQRWRAIWVVGPSWLKRLTPEP